MKVSTSNRKLGNGIVSISRPVGPTCPQTCPFLANGCYAERMQSFRLTVKNAWRQGMTIDPVQVARDILKENPVALRIHVGGDFLAENGNLDRSYLAGLLRTLRRVRDSRGQPLPAWVYTHAWLDLNPHTRYLRMLSVECFASVHSQPAADKAAVMGYRLAIDGETRYKGVRLPVKGNGGLTCPEQRKGVTCSDCKYCFRPPTGREKNVVFYRH